MSQDEIPGAIASVTDHSIVEARFYVNEVKLQPLTDYPESKPDGSPDYSKGVQIMGGAVQMGAAKHGTFGRATPSGSVQMLIQNEPAFLVFKEAFERSLKENGRTPRFRVYFVLDDNQEPA